MFDFRDFQKAPFGHYFRPQGLQRSMTPNYQESPGPILAANRCRNTFHPLQGAHIPNQWADSSYDFSIFVDVLGYIFGFAFNCWLLAACCLLLAGCCMLHRGFHIRFQTILVDSSHHSLQSIFESALRILRLALSKQKVIVETHTLYWVDIACFAQVKRNTEETQTFTG